MIHPGRDRSIRPRSSDGQETVLRDTLPSPNSAAAVRAPGHFGEFQDCSEANGLGPVQEASGTLVGQEKTLVDLVLVGDRDGRIGAPR
jgi:hypothetical protein